MKKIKITLLLLVILLQGCQWKHDGKILKDKDGNLYKLKSSEVRSESYDLIVLPAAEIDSLLNSNKKHER